MLIKCSFKFSFHLVFKFCVRVHRFYKLVPYIVHCPISNPSNITSLELCKRKTIRFTVNREEKKVFF